MTLSSRLDRIEQQVQRSDLEGDWVEIPYEEFRLRQAQRFFAGLEDFVREHEDEGPPRQLLPEEEAEAERELSQLLRDRRRTAWEKEEANPSTKWENPYTPEARFLVRRDVYEKLPPLEPLEGAEP